MNKPTTISKCIIIFIVLIAVTIGVVICKSILGPTVAITSASIEIVEEGYHPANYKQNESMVDLSVFDNKLYFYPRQFPVSTYETKYHQYLSVFEDGTARRIARFKTGMHHGVITIGNGYLYYWESAWETAESDDVHLYAYNLLSGEETFLATMPLTGELYYLEDGTLLLSTGPESTAYYIIKGCVLCGQTSQKERFILNEHSYAVEEHDGMEEIVRYDEAGNQEILRDEIPYGYKSLIPCDEGLLVHNEWAGGLLYFIDGDSEEIVKLFSVDCMASISAVNVHNGYAYLSFKRYEKHGEFGMVRYENDNLEGTYRIRLYDGAVEKLSDHIYSALYIFDDTGIYACDDYCNIYKLDYDGKRILTLLEQEVA